MSTTRPSSTRSTGRPARSRTSGSCARSWGARWSTSSTSEVPDGSDWRDWHRPLDVGPLRVRAPWAPERPGALDVVIDPGQAFGTGAHPSTRLTLELLGELPAGGPLADWGCGSGILAVAAARLGFDPVLACDHEREAVAATLAAAEANGVEVTVTRCDLRRAPGPWAPTVLANLVRPLLLEIAALMERPPERLIASGLEAARSTRSWRRSRRTACAWRRAATATAGPPSCWSDDLARRRPGRGAPDRRRRAPHAGPDLAGARRGDRRDRASSRPRTSSASARSSSAAPTTRSPR